MRVTDLIAALLKLDMELEVEVEVGGSLWPTDCVTVREVWYDKPGNRRALILLDRKE